MFTLRNYEDRVAEINGRHPDMPRNAVMLVRFSLFLQRKLEDRLAGILAAHELSHSAWSLLMMIYSSADRAISPSCASDALRQSRAHMTRMTDELVDAGWVERTPFSGDRRAIDVRLTPAGEARLQQLLPAVWSEYERLLECFSADEAKSLEGLLRKWILHLERGEAEPAVGAREAARDQP